MLDQRAAITCVIVEMELIEDWRVVEFFRDSSSSKVSPAKVEVPLATELPDLPAKEKVARIRTAIAKALLLSHIIRQSVQLRSANPSDSSRGS